MMNFEDIGFLAGLVSRYGAGHDLSKKREEELIAKLINSSYAAGILQFLLDKNPLGVVNLMTETCASVRCDSETAMQILRAEMHRFNSKIERPTPPTPWGDETSVSNLDGQPLPPQVAHAQRLYSEWVSAGRPRYSSPGQG